MGAEPSRRRAGAFVIDVLFAHYGEPWLRGSENCLLELVSRLDRGRFRPRVLCNQELLRAAFAARDIEALQLDLPEIMVDGSYVRLELGSYLLTTQRILALARARRPALVYCNSGRASQASWLAARLLGIPRLCHIHAPFYRRYYWLWGLGDARAIVFPSEATRRRSLTPHHFRGEVHVVPNGADLERFRPAVARDPAVRRYLGIDEGEIVLGQIGSLIWRKGADVLLRALAIVRERHPVRLLLAGGGTERIRLEALARELGVGSAVSFLGEVRRPEALLQHALDVNVLAAREESLPLSLIEASACGLPSVCTDVGGNGEAILHGETGLLVAAGDPGALAGALLRLVEDAGLRARFGVAARRRAEKHFGVDAFVVGIERAMLALVPAASGEAPRRATEAPSRGDGHAPPTGAP